MFWVREKNQFQAEVDFVVPYKGQAVPLEVKSGSTGRLCSLHQYVEQSGCTTAMRDFATPAARDVESFWLLAVAGSGPERPGQKSLLEAGVPGGRAERPEVDQKGGAPGSR